MDETTTTSDPRAVTETILGRVDAGRANGGQAPAERGSGWARGATLGRYVLLEALASGGCGTVFAALDPELDRRVALKLLHSRSGGGADSRRWTDELRSEARTLAQVRHPNVATVYDAGSHGDQVFLAMELLDGESLHQWLSAGGRSRDEVLRVFLEAGRGLAAAHRAGVVHRDFKPANVMITSDGRVLVVDFGLATAAGEPAGAGFQGTPAYAAPEQLAGRASDQRSDLFSFCVSLWSALCGERPWPGAGADDLREAYAAGAPPSLRAGGKLPATLRRALARGLAIDPAQRWADLKPVLAAVQSLLRRRGRRAAVALGALAVVAVATAVAVRSLPSPDLCAGGEAELAGLWTAPQRAALIERAAAQPIASVALGERVAGLLDARRAEWLASFRTACVETRVRKTQSEEMLDAQRVCLDRRRQELAAAVEVLLDPEGPLSAGSPAADKALAVAGDVPSARGCLDRVRLSAGSLPPPAPDQQGAVADLRGRLALARANENAGRYGLAAELAETALTEAAEVGYEPLEAEARLVAGSAHGRLGQWSRMRQEILQSTAGALRHGDPELAAEGFSYLMVASVVQGRLDEARQWNLLADAGLGAVGRPPDREQHRLQFLAMLAIAERSWQEAIDAIEQARRLRSAAGQPASTALDNNLALALGNLGRYDEAERQLLASLANMEELYGRGHIQTAAPLSNLGELAAERGDHAGAIRYFRAADACFTASSAASHPNRAYPLTDLGASLLALGRPREALDKAEAAIALREAAGVGAHELAASYFLRARALAALGPGRSAEARRAAAHARELCRSAGSACSILSAIEGWRPGA